VQKRAKKCFIWALTNTDFLPQTNADFLPRITGGGKSKNCLALTFGFLWGILGAELRESTWEWQDSRCWILDAGSPIKTFGDRRELWILRSTRVLVPIHMLESEELLFDIVQRELRPYKKILGNRVSWADRISIWLYFAALIPFARSLSE